MLDREALISAIKRIALTPDGELLNLYLQMKTQEIPASHDPGALQAHVGERRFAHELKALMDSAASENARDGRQPGYQRLIVAKQPAVRLGRRSRRRGQQSPE